MISEAQKFIRKTEKERVQLVSLFLGSTKILLYTQSAYSPAAENSSNNNNNLNKNQMKSQLVEYCSPIIIITIIIWVINDSWGISLVVYFYRLLDSSNNDVHGDDDDDVLRIHKVWRRLRRQNFVNPSSIIIIIINNGNSIFS
jgi:hypothetical protein